MITNTFRPTGIAGQFLHIFTDFMGKLRSALTGKKTALIAAVFAIGFTTACGSNTDTKPTPAPTVSSNSTLQQNAAALQRTVLEGAVVGATAGSLLGRALSGKKEGSKRGFQIGLPVGITAGSYVAFLQKKYRREEDRLDRAIADIDKTNALLAQTLANMRNVLAQHQIEAAQAAAARTTPPDVSQNASLIQSAINGAEARRAEFGQVRALGMSKRNGETLDPHVDLMIERIAAMRAVAAQLAALQSDGAVPVKETS